MTDKEKAELTESNRNITVAECERKHRAMFRLVTVVIFLFIAAVTSVAWSFSYAWIASSRASELANEFRVHNASQNGSFKTIEVKLKTIELHQSEMKEDLKEQHRMLTDILKGGERIHPPNSP